MPSSTPSTGPDVALLVKQGCHLCEAAAAVVEEVCSEQQVPWRLIHGEDQPQLLQRHAEEVPVLFVDGVQRDFWRVDPQRLHRLIEQSRAHAEQAGLPEAD